MEYDLINRVLVHITSECNLACHHCYSSAFQGENQFYNDFSHLQKILKIINKPVDISGGEPFMFRRLRDFVESSKNHGVRISSIFTNGTLVERNTDIVEYLRENHPHLRFYVSIDGFEGSHDGFRGKGNYELAIKGAKLLKSMGFRVFINTILHNRITDSDIENLFFEIENNGFDRWRVDTPFNAGNWTANRNAAELDSKDVFGYFNQVLRLWQKRDRPFELEIDHVLKYLDGKFYFIDKYSLDNPICPCRLLVIWANGDITWCQDLYGAEYIISNIYKQTPEEIYSVYSNFKTRTIGETKNRLEDCWSCGFIQFCGTGCRANAILDGNDYFGKDEEICHIYKSGLYKTIAETLIKGKGG